jgi:hypothetical protein
MSDAPVAQFSRAVLANMTSAEIVAAQTAGHLDALLGVKMPEPPPTPTPEPDEPHPMAWLGGRADLGARGEKHHRITREDLGRMSSAEIVDLQNRGLLDHLLRGES